MSDYELLETKKVRVQDNYSAWHNFEMRMGRRILTQEKLELVVLYTAFADYPVLSMNFIKGDAPGEYKTDYLSGWLFELPEEIRFRDIGHPLWKKIEKFFLGYNITFVIGTIGQPVLYGGVSEKDERKIK